MFHLSLEPPSHQQPPPAALGHHRAPARLVLCSSPHWLPVGHTAVCIWQHCALYPSHPFLPRCVHEPLLTSVSLLLCTQVHQCRFSSLHVHTLVSRVCFSHSLHPVQQALGSSAQPQPTHTRPFSWLVSQGVSVPWFLHPSICPCTRK